MECVNNSSLSCYLIYSNRNSCRSTGLTPKHTRIPLRYMSSNERRFNFDETLLHRDLGSHPGERESPIRQEKTFFDL